MQNIKTGSLTVTLSKSLFNTKIVFYGLTLKIRTSY